jgi:hypothetical protein
VSEALRTRYTFIIPRPIYYSLTVIHCKSTNISFNLWTSGRHPLAETCHQHFGFGSAHRPLLNVHPVVLRRAMTKLDHSHSESGSSHWMQLLLCMVRETMCMLPHSSPGGPTLENPLSGSLTRLDIQRKRLVLRKPMDSAISGTRDGNMRRPESVKLV